jgi:hypothetical protein
MRGYGARYVYTLFAPWVGPLFDRTKRECGKHGVHLMCTSRSCTLEMIRKLDGHGNYTQSKFMHNMGVNIVPIWNSWCTPGVHSVLVSHC